MKSIAIILSLILALSIHTNAQDYTWSEHIAPIIYANCASCHHDGGIAPFELMEYSDFAGDPAEVIHVLEEGTMPPWPANPDYMHFANETVLEASEMEALLWWLENDLPIGNLDEAPDPPVFLPSGSLLETIDYTVEIPPYTLQYNYDEIRWFVIENPFEEDVYISKLEVFPGLEQVVHHADLFYDLTDQSIDADNADPLPGFNNDYGWPNNSYYINAWQPGAHPAEYPPDWGIKVPAGADLVVEIHFGPGGVGETDDTIMNLQFLTETEDVRPVYASWMLYDSAPVLVDGPLYIPANQYATFHQEAYVSNDLSIISICPHMHYLGDSYRVWYEYEGEEYPLIHIPQWDFHWQKYYTFQTIKHIPAGAIMKSEGVYNNTVYNHDQPFDPPQDCYKGGTTLDEMFLCYFIWSNYEEGDENIIMDSTILDIPSFEISANSFGLEVYPNPAQDQITITTDLKNNGLLQYSIYSEIGELVYFKNSSSPSNSVINIKNLSSGMYYFQCQSDDSVATRKFVKY